MTRIKQLIQFVLLFIVTGLYAQQPFFEDFEQAPDFAATDGYWETKPAVPGTAARKWYVTEKGTGYEQPWRSSTYNLLYPAYQGNRCAHIQREAVAPGSKAIDWLVTPAINLAQYQSPKLRFFSRFGFNGNQGSILKVYISTSSQTNTASFQLLKQWTEPEMNTFQQDYTQIFVDIPAQYANSTAYLAFVMETNDGDRWLIDDVYVGSACLDPTTITFSEITTSSTKVSWNTPGPNNEWEVFVSDADNFSPTFNNPTTVNQPFTTITTSSDGLPLQEGNHYRVYVRSKCHADNQWTKFSIVYIDSAGGNCQTPVVIPPNLPYIATARLFAGLHNDNNSNVFGSNPGTDCGNNSAGYLNGKYTVHTYTPTSNTTINIIAQTSTTYTGLFVYNSCANIGVNCMASSVNDLVLKKGIYNLPVTAGTTYYIVVGSKESKNKGIDATAINSTTRFSLSISEPCSSSNIEATFTAGSAGASPNTYNVIANVTSMGGASSLSATLYNELGNMVETKTITNPGIVSFTLSSNAILKPANIVLQNPQNPNCLLISPRINQYYSAPAHDECQNAGLLTMRNDWPHPNYYYLVGSGNFTKSTASSQPVNCLGAYRDLWYKFVATNTEHHIKFVNSYNDDLTHSLYSGTNCGALTLLYCSRGSFSKATGLTIGQTYTIRVSDTGLSENPIAFEMHVATPPANCMTTNPQSENVKILLVNLMNALSKRISTASSPPFTCPELTQLTPFINVSNPMIHYLSSSGNYDGLAFAFTNSSSNIHDMDVFSSDDGPVKDLFSYDYTSPNIRAQLHVANTNNVSITLDKNWVQKINFCPAPCDPIGGKIVINPGVSCVATGAATPFALQTSAGNIANYTWIIYNDKMNPVASYYTANPTVTVNGSGTYMARLIVTTTTGCTTKFEKYFWVSKTCPSAGDENGNGIPDNTEPGSDPTNPGSGIPNNCALYNPRSEIVKELYINLINHLFDLVTSGVPIPTTYSSPQVVALAPYINGGEPILYNITYVDKTLKFTISGGEHYIIVKNNGPINDIYLENFDLNGATYKTTYINGSADDTHFIKYILFCADSPCGEASILGSIEFSPNLNSIPPFSNVQLNLNFNEIPTSYQWRIKDYTNTILFESNESNPIVNIPLSSVQPHIVSLMARYGDHCALWANKLAFAPDINPSNYCSETNPKTLEIKKLLINLINRLYIQIYAAGQWNMPSTYTSEETVALAPYNIYNSPSVYDVTWDRTTSTLRFSFYPNQPSPDVQIDMTGSLEDLAILVPYNDPGNYITAFALNFTKVTQPLIKSIIFCPYDGENCTQLPGEIKLSSGVSCIQANTPVGFSISSDYTSYPYTWTFYNQTGTSVIGTSSEPFPYITYATPGNYLVKLEIDVNNCKSTFYKTVTVSASCGNDTGNGNGTGSYCTETNEDTVLVKQLFQTFLNSLFNLNGQIPNGYTNIELSALSPYITTPNPAVYNIRFSNNALSFSFSPNTSQPDVVIGNYGTVVDLNILNYSGTGNPSYIATYQDGRQYTNLKVNNIIFCPEQPCESHVAFVFDESASISNEEAQKIRIQLRAFVEQQLNSNMTVSFTGMADSDNYTRTDHVYDKITPATRYKFDNWINKYKTGYTPVRPGVSANSDYWASGLKQAMQGYSLIPEIVIMITDGSQTTNVPALKQQMANIANNEDSHLYIFGIGNGYYVNDTTLPPDPNAYTNTNISDVTPRLMSSIKYLMEMAPTEFPVSGKDNLLSADYFETKDFSEFGNELTDPNGRFFSDRLANANIGCSGEAIPLDFCYDCETFQPAPGQTYWLSAWATEEQNIQVKTFTNAIIKMTFLNQAKIKVGEISFLPEGDIIDGWQRFASKFEIPATATMLNIELENLSPSIPVYFDDIRIHPLQGSMKSFVYDPETFRLMAEQDDNNYSTFYEYDNEGGLVRIKKETSKGIKTIQETRSGSVIQSTGN